MNYIYCNAPKMATRYDVALAGEDCKTLLSIPLNGVKRTKSVLMKTVQSVGEDVLTIVGDGEVEYIASVKALKFSGKNGIFFAKFVKKYS